MSATSEGAATATADPRALLAEWANSMDEWVRLLVSEVITTGHSVTAPIIEKAYELFRQEKTFESRTMPIVGELCIGSRHDETTPPLSVVRLSEVRGVNALVTGEVIEFHEGLTILHGENGTGKTGYVRILKALADSRTAGEILGNIEAGDNEDQAATIEYKLGDQDVTLGWAGERGLQPFTRLSIFDSPSVSTHVDEDLDYVYVPATLAIFNHVVSAIKSVSARIDSAISNLASDSTALLSLFPKNSSVYPFIETLGASTNLEGLKAMASTDPEVEGELEELRQAVAALKSNTLTVQITALKQDQRVLEQAFRVAEALVDFDANAYNQTLRKRVRLEADYHTIRSELFSVADLPSDPEETWNAFVVAGEEYRQHLLRIDAHDPDRCLYCRQTLSDPARDLLDRYSTYLEDKISAEILETDSALGGFKRSVELISGRQLADFVEQFATQDEQPTFFSDVQAIEVERGSLVNAIMNDGAIELDLDSLSAHKKAVESSLATVRTYIEVLQKQSGNRETALAAKNDELVELQASVELARSWTAIEVQVKKAKESEQLRNFRDTCSKLSRSVTDLSKLASDQLMNQSFDTLFLEECEVLRAPELKVQFIGREGKPHRRKVLSGQHKPSLVLSEGEQKVLALADFLAETRLAGATAPVIFDDPVSSLDHRRIKEVAQRIARLAEDSQVIVFTHDIFLATTLLALFEKSKRCSYFQVTDEYGKGKVTRSTGPRWDTLNGIKAEINKTIQAAKQQEGVSRQALVRTGYDWVRSWCEVFTETELLQGVTQRYQPNVGMTKLDKINTEKLGDIIPWVNAIFDEACRFIDGHSQPLPTLGVGPTLSGLESHWVELKRLKDVNDGKV